MTPTAGCVSSCSSLPDLLESSKYGHTLVGVDTGIGLRHLVVDASLLDHADVDVVGLAGNLDALRRHLAEDTDTNARAGERVAHDQVVVDVEGAADGAHLVLEEQAEGLKELQV